MKNVQDKLERGGADVLVSFALTPGEHPLNMVVQPVLALLGAFGVLALFLSAFLVINMISAIIAQQQQQIGMMKAVGMRNRELTGTLIVEAVTMTLSSALAGITAGTIMGVVVYVGETLGSGAPFVFAFDGIVAPFIVVMVVLASIIGATFSARRIIKRRAIEILRM